MVTDMGQRILEVVRHRMGGEVAGRFREFF